MFGSSSGRTRESRGARGEGKLTWKRVLAGTSPTDCSIGTRFVRVWLHHLELRMAQEKWRLALDPDATCYAGLAVRYAADLITQNARNGVKYVFRTGEPHAADEKDVAIFCRCHILVSSPRAPLTPLRHSQILWQSWQNLIYHFSLRFTRRNAKKRERAIHVLIIPYREAWHADTDSH